MTVETITKFKCDRCEQVTEYGDEQEQRKYTFGLSLVNGDDVPYMPRRADLCRTCVIDAVHQWWRKLSPKPKDDPHA